MILKTCEWFLGIMRTTTSIKWVLKNQSVSFFLLGLHAFQTIGMHLSACVRLKIKKQIKINKRKEWTRKCSLHTFTLHQYKRQIFRSTLIFSDDPQRPSGQENNIKAIHTLKHKVTSQPSDSRVLIVLSWPNIVPSQQT